MWLFTTFAILLTIMILEIARLTPLLFRELKFESDLDFPPTLSSCQANGRLSIIVPAKDEEANIKASVESILASSYQDLEIILVDDRSHDGTWQLMELLQRLDNRVKTVKIEKLPAGWTGKTHAMYVGAGVASGDMLLFTDADALFSRDLLVRAISYFVSNQLDMLSLIPGFKKWGFLEKSIYPHLALGISFFYPITSVNDPRSGAAVSSGCFIMMSRKSYNEVGTWRSLRGQITEDIAMSRAVKALGLKLRVSRSDLVQTKPFDNITELIRFWRRTFCGGLENGPIKVLRLWLNYTPLLIPFGLVVYFATKMATNGNIALDESVLFGLSIMTILAIEIPFGIFLKHYHGRWLYTLLSPFGIFTGFWIATLVLFTKMLNIGIEWRGSVYK
ncbi:MAG: glycosyltransferase [Deltaproteobacteria bacterium]|nr:glycosyltransferase [Deltaproteobacteria bacterium]